MFSKKTIAALTATELLAAASDERENARYNKANGFETAAMENARIAAIYETEAAKKF